ncbi:MAG TPA: pseudouridine synthase, partial [Methylomirabilota bacterium]|nr:pseudouridine synthase [Methylomirabilota bacterium]
HASEGLHEWLQCREPRWASLGIIHRLDKETSGVMVFGKTPLANKSLTEQFATRKVRKVYRLLTDRAVMKDAFTVQTKLGRIGERYSSSYRGADAQVAITEFKKVEVANGITTLEAHPVTGRTHQIRVHASESGFPILGDTLYGGRPASRVHLHAAELQVAHPATGQRLTFSDPFPQQEPSFALRDLLIAPEETNAFRLLHGGSDRQPGFYLERWGEYLLASSEGELLPAQRGRIEAAVSHYESKGAAHKIWRREVRGAALQDASPKVFSGVFPAKPFAVRENGVAYEISFQEGYSVGLFLDQRDNRRRLLTNYVAPKFDLFPGGLSGKRVLNTFAYTCGFSVCAAKAGALTTSLDLSQKYLTWGQRNFALNEISLQGHEFIYGDAFNWMERFAKKGRQFDMIVLDPPTFSKSKEHGVFQAERDYGKLIAAALPLLPPNGVILASTNAAKMPPLEFIAQLKQSVADVRRQILQMHYAPQPPDFPATREEPAYLKTVWLRVN